MAPPFRVAELNGLVLLRQDEIRCGVVYQSYLKLGPSRLKPDGATHLPGVAKAIPASYFY